MEPAWDSFSPFLSAPSLLMLSLSLKINKKNFLKNHKIILEISLTIEDLEWPLASKLPWTESRLNKSDLASKEDILYNAHLRWNWEE